MKRFRIVVLLVPVLSGGFAPEAVTQETGREYCDRFIRRVPFTIAQPGHYCVGRNLVTGAPIGIRVLADDVTLDMNNFKLESTAGPGAVTNGIFADSHRNITIKNGTIRGFYGGILLGDAGVPGSSENHVVENVRVEESGFYGIQIDGFNSAVRGCTISNIGGSTAIENTGGRAFGVIMFKGASVAIDNSVLGFYPMGAGTATGMWFANGNFAVVGNRVAGGTLSPTVGIRIDTSEGGYRDNIVWRVDTDYVGGLDLGNNAAY